MHGSSAPALAEDVDTVPQPARVDGQDRYETAANVALLTYDTTQEAIVTTGKNFPDALAASYGAGQADAPILLARTQGLPDSTAAALDELDVERVTLVGGERALHPDVDSDLEDRGYETFRAAGDDRYDTARVVADAWGRKERSARSRATMQQLDIERVVVVGGTAAVGEETLGGAILDIEARCVAPDTFIGEISTVDRESDPFPGVGETAELVEVRAAEHDGFDRIVFEFDGPDRPGWSTALDDPPLVHPQSEEEIRLEGDAYIGTNFVPAVAQWGDGAYDGPERIEVDGGIVTEVVQVMDFEDQLMWAIGLDDEDGYATGFRDGPTRFIVDVAHEDTDW